jgi:hypothetical protein
MQLTHSQFKIDGTWNPAKAKEVGGKSSLPFVLSTLLHLTSFLDEPEILSGKK